MSIIDKLPEVPKGGKWNVYITEYGGVPKAWVGLKPDLSMEGTRVILHAPSGFLVEPTEEAIVSGAISILKAFEANTEEANKRSSRVEAYKSAYADLITED